MVLPLINALDMYGRMSRFSYLDQLGDAPRPRASPDDAGRRIETAALIDSAGVALYRDVTTDAGDNEAGDWFITALKERIAIALERVWSMIAVRGRNYALGETGGTFGFEVHPDAVGRQ